MTHTSSSKCDTSHIQQLLDAETFFSHQNAMSTGFEEF